MTVSAPIPDGLYLGLSEVAYHADAALGSTDLKNLAISAPDWWHASTRNPAREPDADTPSRLYGRALHKCVLEGREAFDATYRTTLYSGSTKAGKEERAYIESIGATALKNDDHIAITAAGGAIRANPYLAASFVGGVPEVSVFWTDPATGVRLKCRQDYVKARATVDLKSIRPQRPGPFPQSCLRAIAEWRYHGQAAHYTDGRFAMHAAIREGRVFGDHDPAWLKALSSDFAFVFVFIQADGAPLTWGTKLSPDNAAIHNGRERVRRGLAAYLDYSERFPNGAPWLDHEPLRELNIDDLSNWSLI